MDSRLRVAGQAVQPVLVMFPLGLFAMAVIFDLADLLGAPEIVGSLAYWNIAAGLVGGILAAVAGAVDLMFLQNGTQAKRAGVLQALMNMGVLLLFAVVFMMRMRTPDRVAGGGVFVIELLALAAAGYGAWYCASMVARPRRAQVADTVVIKRPLQAEKRATVSNP